MTLLTAPDEPRLAAAAPPRMPVLRLRRRGEASEQTHSLGAGKCTVGSSPQCQICLPTAEVRPLQCLITLESNAASVTRWAAGVQLNGREFSKASLTSGDRLTIGSWELEFDRGGGARGFESTADARDELPYEADEQESTAIWDVPEREEAPGAETSVARLSEPTPASAPESTAPVAVQIEQVAYGANAPAHAFEDRLVQHLWTANFQARRRAKALINDIRAARFHADAMSADLSAMETELDLARAAYDSHIVNDDRLQQELAEQRRQHEERLAPLMAEISSLKLELELAQAALVGQAAEYEALAAELATLQMTPAAPAVDPVAASRTAELEVALITQSQHLESITLQLQAAQDEQLRLAQRYEAESDRASALEAAIAELQAADAVGAVVEQVPATSLNKESAAEVWRNVAPLEEAVPPQAAAPNTWAGFEPVAEVPSETPVAAFAETVMPQPASSPWTLPADPIAHEEAPAPVITAPQTADSLQPALTSAPEIKQAQPAEPPKTEAPAWAAAPAAQPASQYTSTSFIDKYRHLLEEDDAASSPAPGRGPVIDDEFLSPAKAQTCASPADESDEALEAYMANMMRRVRTSASTFANDPPVHAAPEPTPSLVSRLLESGSQPVETAAQPTVDAYSDQPLSFEELKLATRKVPLASDLAALREIANSTARTAIATHSSRQSRESAITKTIVAITATVSAGYLMASAPALDTWQFWAGAATCATGITAAVQVLILERRHKPKR